MKVIKNKRQGFVVSLEIEAPLDNFEEFLHKAFLKYRKDAKVQGFRKGKVTRAVFEKNYGKDILIEEATHYLVNQSYIDAVKSLDLKVVDYPKNMNVDPFNPDKPLRFTCEVDVEPEGKLGKYKGLAVKKKDDEVKAEDVQKVMDQFRDRSASFELTDEACSEGSILRISLKATLDGENYEAWSKESTGLRLGSALYGSDFDTEVLGLKKDDAKSFEITYPEDFHIEALKTKTVAFDVTVLEVRAKKLPDLSDEWVKENVKDEGVDSVDSWKIKIEEQLKVQLESENKKAIESEVIDAALEKFEIDIPQGMIDQEVERSVQYFAQEIGRMNIGLDQYLSQMNISAEKFRDNFKENAQKTVKTQLFLGQLIKKEKISATDEDIETLIQSWNDEKIKSLDDLKNTPNVDIENIRDSLSRQQGVDFLVSSAKIS